MSWWFGSKPSNEDNKKGNKSSTHDHGDVEAENKVEMNPKRISTSWLQAPDPTKRNHLEEKSAQHNLLDEQNYASCNSTVLGSRSIISNHSRCYDSYLEPKRISSRPLHIIRQSDSDILRFKEENYRLKQDANEKFMSIPILPADEMNSLTSEIKLWHKTRKSFRVIFYCSIICCLGVLAVSLAFTTFWYSESNLDLLASTQYRRQSSFFYNLHMNAHVVQLLLLTWVLNLFRMLPQTKLTKVILYHVIISFLAYAVSVVGVFYAIIYHEDFMQIKAHFYSLHSWIGLMSHMGSLYVFVTGFLMLYYPCNKLKNTHSRGAMMTFILCSGATICGFFQRALIQIGPDYGYISLPGIIANSVVVLVVIYAILVRLSAASFMYRRRPRPQWDVIVYRSLEPIEDVYLEIHDMYESFEMWVKQVNQVRLKALRVPHSSVRSSYDLTYRNEPPQDSS